jgi:hypothetical protein
MAYLANATNGPNGGRLNFAYTGNTTGTAAMAVNSTGIVYLSGGTNVTLSQNAATLSIGMPRPGGTTQLSRWEAPEDVYTTIGTLPQGSLSIQHQYIPFNVTAQSARIAAYLSVPVGGLAGNASGSTSLWMGIYGLTNSSTNSSVLTLLSSGSANNSTTWNAALLGGNASALSGPRQLTVPINVNMTPGEYWVGAVVSTATGGNPDGINTASIYGNNLVTAGNGIPFLPLGLGTSITSASAGGFVMFQGIHKTASYTMPANIQGTQINNSAASAVQLADFYFGLYNISNM